MVEVTIIGAGPAGIAAALQLKRSGIEPLLLERDRIGGLLGNANLVENYPGFPQGISGEELVRLFKEQLEAVGVEVFFEEVLRLDHDGRAFVIETGSRQLASKTVVLASGTAPRAFVDCEIPPRAKQKVFYEVYPLREVRGKGIAIVGAGDAAFDYALNLGRRNEVTILNRGDQVKCLPLLWERAAQLGQISYRANTAIAEMGGCEEGLRLELATGNRRWTLRADYAILAIGRVARLDFLSQRLRERIERLREEGVLYQVGDVRRGPYRQTAIAVGDGIEAAMRIYRRLKEGQR